MIWSQCIRMFNVCGFFTCLWLVVCQFRCAECFCVLHPDQLFSQKQTWKVFILPCSLQPLLFWPRSSLQFKITLIIIRLHAGPVMVLIEQISITSIWTGGSSPPWTSLSSPFALSFFSPPSSSPLFFFSSLSSQADGFDEHPLWTLSVSAGITNTGEGSLWCGRGELWTQKGGKGLLAWWGCCKRPRGIEKGPCGLKQASTLRSFPYKCLSLGISRPPAGKMRPRTLTWIYHVYTSCKGWLRNVFGVRVNVKE